MNSELTVKTIGDLNTEIDKQESSIRYILSDALTKVGSQKKFENYTELTQGLLADIRETIYILCKKPDIITATHIIKNDKAPESSLRFIERIMMRM